MKARPGLRCQTAVAVACTTRHGGAFLRCRAGAGSGQLPGPKGMHRVASDRGMPRRSSPGSGPTKSTFRKKQADGTCIAVVGAPFDQRNVAIVGGRRRQSVCGQLVNEVGATVDYLRDKTMHSCQALGNADERSSSRTIGATRVPNNSIAFITFACGIVPTESCMRKRWFWNSSYS